MLSSSSSELLESQIKLWKLSHLKRRMKAKGPFEFGWRVRKHYNSHPMEECNASIDSKGENLVWMSTQCMDVGVVCMCT